MSQISIKTSSICDKAGRSYNQDNFWLCPDLSQYQTTNNVVVEEQETEISLSDKGALLLVADGMGGMNAGEVASQIIIDSVKQSFLNTDSIDLDNKDDVNGFIKKVIVDADENVKKHAADNPDTAGMGSTIVLAWILGQTVHVGWCGDSRAYCYNEKNGLVRLSHDHSYVQGLVDNGTISEDEAFDHPNSNIITRSLGDSGEKAKPEIKDYPIHNGDIFLLCTDGLCGVLRDNEIEEIMSKNHQSVDDCLKALWINGKEVGWTDNVTIELAKIVSGGSEPDSVPMGYDKPKSCSEKKSESNKRSIVILVSFILAFLAVGVLVIILNNNSNEKRINELNSMKEELERQMDSLRRINDSLDNLHSVLQQSQKTEDESFYIVDVTSDDDKYIYSHEEVIDQVLGTEETEIDDVLLTPIYPKDSIKD